ncbi:MAG TPA: hypothetical protein VK853_11800 [Ilumatobacteraceae bacterium]|nr:hypothetical protein [Ilumatobacteraceae bacterium]
MASWSPLDPTRVDLTDFDVTAVDPAALAGRAADRAANLATNLAKDVTYVTVGLGLLTFQRAQVRRREIERRLRR